jgi:hypothetical protein
MMSHKEKETKKEYVTGHDLIALKGKGDIPGYWMTASIARPQKQIGSTSRATWIHLGPHTLHNL